MTNLLLSTLFHVWSHTPGFFNSRQLLEKLKHLRVVGCTVSSEERFQPKRWAPTYVVLLLSLIILSAVLVILYLRTGSEAYLGWALLMALMTAYTGWSFARLLAMKTVPRSIFTHLKCPSCSYEVTREYKETDALFAEAEPCPKCGGKMLIEGIFLHSPSKIQRTV